ncbi:MAG: amino acid ABC transporter permease [Bdellovibrionales bacterium]|nr:amino acid ABC transporter permease [Bdellovibrionales bacterium]
MNSFFQWQIFIQDTGAGETYLQWLMSAWRWTLAVSFFAWVIAIVVGTIVGIMRTLPNRFVATLGTAWTELFRNIPILVQIFIWYHVIPTLFLSLRAIPSFALVVIALGFFTSARIAEQVKAGIESLSKGQLQAGLALGLTRTQTYRYVLMPLAFRIIVPPLTSESMGIIKNSSVAFAVSISELTMFALQAGEETSRNIEFFFATTFLYFISAYAVNHIALFIERKLRLPGTQGGSR